MCLASSAVLGDWEMGDYYLYLMHKMLSGLIEPLKCSVSLCNCPSNGVAPCDCNCHIVHPLHSCIHAMHAHTEAPEVPEVKMAYPDRILARIVGGVA